MEFKLVVHRVFVQLQRFVVFVVLLGLGLTTLLIGCDENECMIIITKIT